MRELGGLERKKDGRCDHNSLMRAVDWQSLFLSSQLAREMTTLLLVWQGADRLDCTYGQMGIVKHYAGTLGVSWVTNGAPNIRRIARDHRGQEG